MEKKLFKRIGLLGLSTLTAFTFVANVKAADNCTTYKNYFYFSQASYEQFIKERTDNYTKPYSTSTKYLFPLNATIKREGVICLTKGNTTQSINNNQCIDTWTLERYYDSDPTANGAGHEETFEGNTYTYYESGTGNTLERHYFHGKWVNTDGAETDAARPYPANRDVAIGSMMFPTHTTITRSNGLHFALSRQYDVNSVPSTTPDNGWFYAPAVYYVEYEVCEEEAPKYKATINYYYWDMVNDKKPTNPQKVRFEDTTKANPYETQREFNNGYKAQTPVVSPTAAIKNCKPVEKDVTIEIKNNTDFTHDVYYKCSYSAKIHYCIEKEDGTCVPATDVDEKAKDYSKTGLVPDGKEVNVDSPTIKNCKLKNSNQKKVTYSIDKDVEKAKDFSAEVRYVCDEEVPTPPVTGAALIITAWAVGLGALGYSAYYFINARKEENADL